eukprot:1087077-Amphidinium_carterae.1
MPREDPETSGHADLDFCGELALPQPQPKMLKFSAVHKPPAHEVHSVSLPSNSILQHICLHGPH